MDDFGKDDLKKFPYLTSALLGVPPWARYLRPLNAFNHLAVLILAIIVGILNSFGAGFAYVGIYIIGSVIIAIMGKYLAMQDLMFYSIILSTIFLVALNISLVFYFL